MKGFRNQSGLSKIVSAPIMTLDRFVENHPDLCKHKSKNNLVGMTSGGFDPINPGHAGCILDSSNHCDILVVAVNGDSFLTKKKGHLFMNVDARCRLISFIRGVDYVVSFDGFDENDMTAERALKSIVPDIFFKGEDREDITTIPEWNLCLKLRIDIKTGMGKVG